MSSVDSSPCIIEEEIIVTESLESFPPLQSKSNPTPRPGSASATVMKSSSSPSPLPAISKSPEAVQPLPLSVLRSRAKKEKKGPEELVANRSTPNSDKENKTSANSGTTINGKINGHKSPRPRINDSSSLSDTNEYWWNQGYDSSTSEESLSWRRRDNNSPPRFFSNWRQDMTKHKKKYDLRSTQDFPAL